MKNEKNLATVGGRIKFARGELSRKLGTSISQDKLAEMCGWQQTRIGNYETNFRAPDPADLSKIAHITGVRAEWLLFGTGDIYESGVVAKYLVQEDPRSMYNPGTKQPVIGKDTVQVEVLDIAASMGFGKPQPDGDTIVDHLRLSVQWVKNNIHISKPENLAVITGYGDSMAPTYQDGDILLVDRGIDRLAVDAVYVMAFKKELYIKRIQRRPNGTYRMISDNDHYDPYDFSESDLKELEVLGRVLWAWNGRRL